MIHLIAFAGPKYSGKDTAAKGLLDQNGRYGEETFTPYVRQPMAEGVKNIVKDMFGYTDEQIEDAVLKEVPTDTWPHVAPRWPMMDIANWLREKYGPDIHCHRHERRLRALDQWIKSSTTSNWAVLTPDWRFPNESDYFNRLRSEGRKVLLFYIQRDSAEAALKEKQASGDEMSLNPSEAHYDLLKCQADYIVHNNGSPSAMQNEVMSIVRKELGWWGKGDFK